MSEESPKPPALDSGETEMAQQSRFVRIRFHETSDGLKCIFRGRMDSSATAELEEELKERLAIAEGKHIAFELAAVEYVASAFLRLCVLAAKSSRGNFSILNPTHEVRKVLQISGLDGLIRAS